jgi:hypothetical protein
VQEAQAAFGPQETQVAQAAHGAGE